MSSGKAKRLRRQNRQKSLRERGVTPEQVRESLQSLAAKHLIEFEGALPEDPNETRDYRLNTPERALELCKADPKIYKTAAGNFVVFREKNGGTRFMTPEEAEVWKVDAAELDRRNPGAPNDP